MKIGKRKLKKKERNETQGTAINPELTPPPPGHFSGRLAI